MTHLRIGAAATVALFLGLAPHALTAQQDWTLDLESTLRLGSHQTRWGELYETRVIELQAGDRWRFELSSPFFVPFLTLRAPNGEEFFRGPLTEDRTFLEFDIPLDGHWQVVVSTERPDEAGNYRLRGRRLASAVPPVGESPDEPTSGNPSFRVDGVIDPVNGTNTESWDVTLPMGHFHRRERSVRHLPDGNK